MAAAAAAKVALSDCHLATIDVASEDGGVVCVTLSRAQMEALVQPLLTRMWEAMQRAGAAVFLEWPGRYV